MYIRASVGTRSDNIGHNIAKWTFGLQYYLHRYQLMDDGVEIGNNQE